MKNWMRIAILFFLVTHIATAQEFRYYDQGKLSYADFQGDVLDIDDSTGYMYFQYKTKDTILTINNIDFEVSLFYAGVNVAESWINVNSASTSTLDFFQVLFDIEHLYMEEYNHYMLENPLNANADEVNTLLQEKEIKVEKFKMESVQGSRKDIVEKWKNNIQQKLAALEHNPSELDIQSTYGMEVSFGLAKNFNTNELNDFIGSPLGMGIGFNFNLHNFHFIFSGNIGFTELEASLSESPFWEEGVNVTNTLFSIAIGKRFKFNKITLIPFLGPTLKSLSINRETYQEIYKTTMDTKWNLGVGTFVDFPFIRTYRRPRGNNIYGFTYNNMYQEHGIRLAIQYSLPNELLDQFNGTTLGMSLNYYYYFGNLKQIESN